MSADSSWDVQSAVFAVLSGNAALTSLLANGANSVCDHVPQGTAFPYIAIGETNTAEIEGGAFSVIFSIHTYSKSSGMNETKQIMSAIYDCLHDADFAIPNQNLVLCLMQSSSAELESDGKTRHGIQQFKIITEEV